MKDYVEAPREYELAYVDASRLSKFEMCPAFVLFSRIMGLKRLGTNHSSIAMEYGSDIHEAVPYCYSKDTLQQAKDLFDKRWHMRAYGEDNDKRNCSRAASLLTNFCNQRCPGMCPYEIIELENVAAPEGVEKISKNELPFLVDLGADMLCAGRIDAPVRWSIDKRIWPLDYKGQPLDAFVQTSNGPVKMRDLVVGSQVLGADGKDQEVMGIFPLGTRKVFKVSFSDGTSCECTADHLWNIQKLGKKEPETLELLNIYKEGLHMGEKLKWRIPIAKELKFVPKAVPLDPYLIGVLLGDGCTVGATPKITTPDEEIIDRIKARNKDLVINSSTYIDRCPEYRVLNISKKVRSLDMEGKHSYAKDIPFNYLINSRFVRLEVLRGLMDTDGSVTVHGKPIYTTTSPGLAAHFQLLIESLGGICSTHKYESYCKGKRTKDCYQCFPSVADATELFSLSRKRAKLKIAKKTRRRAITSVTYVRDAVCQCIKVSNEDGLYLTNHSIVTHNTAAEVSPRLFNAFDKSVQTLLYTAALSLIIGEQCPGMLIEAIRVSKVRDELQLHPCFVMEPDLAVFSEWLKRSVSKMLECNQQKRWPKQISSCNGYSHYGIPSRPCLYKPLCYAADYEQAFSMYEKTEPFHPFKVV